MKINVIDYLDFPRISSLLEGFNKTTGFVTAILDLEGNILSSSGWRTICTKFHRVHPKTSEHCLKSDIELSKPIENETYKIYKCLNGLYDLSIPIRIDGEHIANVFTGQFFMDKPDETYFIEQAEKYGFDQESYITALKEVPIIDETKLSSIVDYLLEITHLIIDLTIEKVKLEKSKILLESSLESPKDIIIISLDTNYCYMFFNEAHKHVMNVAYNADIKIGDCIFDHMTSQKDIDSIKRNYDIVLSGKTHETTEVYGDNIQSFYHIKYNPIFDYHDNVIGFTVFAQDITEKRKMEKQLAYHQEIADIYFDVTTDLLIVLDENANISLINDAGCLMLEDSRENIIGLNWFEKFIPLDIIDEIMTVFKTTFKTGILTYSEYVNDIITTKGNIKTVSWKNTLLKDENGAVTSLLGNGKDITQQIENENKLIKLTNTDALTGLGNRRYYEKSLIKYDDERYLPLSVIILDINGLKLINDAFGHQNGDQLLKETANIFKSIFKDKGEVFRTGGDEFAIVLPNTSSQDAENALLRINHLASKVDIQGVKLSISSGVETKTSTKDSLQQVCRSAEDKMYRTKLFEIPSMRSNTIETILATLHEKDQYSRSHSQNVADYCQRFARILGLTESQSKELHTIGLLHDIGKIIIPNDIINKQGKLTKDEYYEVKKHPEIGYRIMNSTRNLRDISRVVLHHHEWWNGNGYPEQISKEEIPEYSRILCIVDAFDAMTSDRTYRKKMSVNEAINELKKYSAIQFDPTLVSIFIEHIDDILLD